MQLWPGARNDTHVDAILGSDGPVGENEKNTYYSDRCATQVTVGGKRDGKTCTSCKDGFMFMMMDGASRTEKCSKIAKSPSGRCIKLSVGLTETTSSDNTLCTKVEKADQLIPVSKLAADAREHYASIEGNGNAVVLCWVRKEVIVPSSWMLAARAPYSRHCVHSQLVRTCQWCATSTRPLPVRRYASSSK